MIGKIVRGDDVGGLLRYLYGPGRANEHLDPHLAGAWDEPHDLEPARSATGRHDLSRLARLLEEPLHAATRSPTKPVWHCALRAAPADRRLSDAEWDEVAREVLHRTGLATRGDEAACRWLAVRHADDHIHLVVTLAREDGHAARPSNDHYRVGEACQAVEKRYDLVRTPDRNRTAAVRPTRAETEKAARLRRPEPTRATLRREVRVAAGGAQDLEDFLDRLRRQGLLVRVRHSERYPDQITGYAVAWPGDHTRSRRPVWYGGGKLAADLTLPRLQDRWKNPRSTTADHAPAGAAPAFNERGRQPTGAVGPPYRDHLQQLRLAASAIMMGDTDPNLIAAVIDLAHLLSRLMEGTRGGLLTAAADVLDRPGSTRISTASSRYPASLEAVRLAASQHRDRQAIAIGFHQIVRASERLDLPASSRTAPLAADAALLLHRRGPQPRGPHGVAVRMGVNPRRSVG